MNAAEAEAGASSARLVVDASVVIKWHVAEVHTDAALRLLRDDGPELHVPDLVFPEVGNILWKKARRGELTEEDVRRIARLVAAAPLTVHPSGPLFEAAIEIALRTARTVYDSQYVALALQLGCQLVTADEKLYNTLMDGPLGAHILWVEDIFGNPAVRSAEDFEIPSFAPDVTADEIELEYSFHTGDRLKDDNLVHLDGMPSLRELYLSCSDVTDAGLVHLRGLAELRTLYLGGTSVTDAGLIHISGLRYLQTLNLTGTAITDDGLAHLRVLTGLRRLMLRETKVTDAGLAHLHNLVELEWLDLGGSAVTDNGLVHLNGLTNLQRLELPNTAVTDAGMVYLRTLIGLRHLDLSGTCLTDAGLPHLHALAGLLELELDLTRVSAAGADQLRRMLPDLEIKAKNLRGPD